MNFTEYQEKAGEFATYPEHKALEYTALGLAGEAGEYAGKVSKTIRDGWRDGKLTREQLIAELGDVLWFVAEAARALDCPLSLVAAHNISKLESRAKRGVLGGSGDDR